MPILSMDSAVGNVLRIIELACFDVEFRDDLFAAQTPVVALKQHDEIIAPHVPEKIAQRIAFPGHDIGGKLDHPVAAPVSVSVVERLELVEVAISGRERRIARQQSRDVLADRNISG